MKIIEVGTGYTSMPPKIGAATEIVAYNLYNVFCKNNNSQLVDISYSIDNTKSDKWIIITLPKWMSKIKDKGFIHYLRRIAYSIKVGIKLKKVIENNNEDIVIHFHNQFNLFFFYIINLFKLRPNVYTIYTIHSPLWTSDYFDNKKFILEKFSIKLASHIVFLNEIILKDIANRFCIDKKYSFIPNGVNTSVYYPISESKKKNLIINVGSVYQLKNQLKTIEILNPFLKENAYEFVFVGKIVDYDYYEKIQNYIKQNSLEKHVRYGGEIEPGNNLNMLYNEAKILISNSICEAFSLIVLESLSSATPVILSDSFNNSLGRYKNSSFLNIVPESNVLACIDTILNDESKYLQISKDARNFIMENFSWDKIGQKHLEIINKLIVQ